MLVPEAPDAVAMSGQFCLVSIEALLSGFSTGRRDLRIQSLSGIARAADQTCGR
jgi:hypothetical protein